MEETVKDWAYNKNGCTAGPTEIFRNNSAVCRTWTGCRQGADVVLCTLEGVPHCWPGRGCPIFVVAPGHQDMNANDHMWRFFSRFTLPGNGSGSGEAGSSVVIGSGTVEVPLNGNVNENGIVSNG